MLQVLARLVSRSAPPPIVEVEAAPPATRPLWEGLTPDEYRAPIRSRIAARAAEERLWRLQMLRVERERARLRRMWAAAAERDEIRSSRWVTNTTEGKK